MVANLTLSFSADPNSQREEGLFPLASAFTLFFVLHRAPGDEEGMSSPSAPWLDRVCS